MTVAQVASLALVAPRKLRFRGWQPADLVIAVCIALLVVVFGILGWLTWLAYGTTLQQAEQRAQTAATLVAGETAWMLSSTMLALQQVADESAKLRESGAEKDLRTMLLGLGQRLPWMHLSVYDAEGHPVGSEEDQVSTTELQSEQVSLLRDGRDWLVAPAFTSGGQPSFLVAQRISRDGLFLGAAVAYVDASFLDRLWNALALGPGSTISFVRTDGLVVARHPALEAPLDLSQLAVFGTLQSAASGTYQSPRSPADGVARVVAFQRVPKYDAIAIASVSQDFVLENLWTAVRTVLYLLAPIAVALLFGSFLVASLLRKSDRTRRHLEAALSHNDVLIREIHHRVKNNLQSVNALLQLHSIPKNVRIDMAQRIAAMSAVHEHMYRSNDFDHAQAKLYLETLIQGLRASYDSDVTLVEKIDDVAIDKDTATPLALIVNEVVSNAYKHAFIDGRRGTIVVDLHADGAEKACLVVADNGVGFAGASSKGIGRRLIAALVEQIGGTSRYSSDEGTRFELTFAIGKHAASRSQAAG